MQKSYKVYTALMRNIIRHVKYVGSHICMKLIYHANLVYRNLSLVS